MFKIYLTNGINVKKTNYDGHNLFYKYVHKVFEDDDPAIDMRELARLKDTQSKKKTPPNV